LYIGWLGNSFDSFNLGLSLYKDGLNVQNSNSQFVSGTQSGAWRTFTLQTPYVVPASGTFEIVTGGPFFGGGTADPIFYGTNTSDQYADGDLYLDGVLTANADIAFKVNFS
jgi:hypothetical protein